MRISDWSSDVCSSDLEKISAGHPNRSSDFDLKHDRGGMVDIEFVTQYLVLSRAAEFPALLDNLGNITLLHLASEIGLIPADLATRVADAYRIFRKKQHDLRPHAAENASGASTTREEAGRERG